MVCAFQGSVDTKGPLHITIYLTIDVYANSFVRLPALGCLVYTEFDGEIGTGLPTYYTLDLNI